jgi:hypothetical protein
MTVPTGPVPLSQRPLSGGTINRLKFWLGSTSCLAAFDCLVQNLSFAWARRIAAVRLCLPPARSGMSCSTALRIHDSPVFVRCRALPTRGRFLRLLSSPRHVALCAGHDPTEKSKPPSSRSQVSGSGSGVTEITTGVIEVFGPDRQGTVTRASGRHPAGQRYGLAGPISPRKPYPVI